MNKTNFIFPKLADFRKNLIFLILFSSFQAANAKAPDDLRELPGKYDNVPLYFTINKGQVNANVAFISKTKNCTMFFTTQGTVFSFGTDSSEPYAVRLSFPNSNLCSEINGEVESSNTTNYFVGNNSSQWKRNVANYQKVKLKNLYQGVDLIYYGNQTRLEYDFMVKPGADPSKIKLSYELGEKKGNALSINKQGDLIISTPLGKVIEHKPYCYQEINGEKLVISGEYMITDTRNNVFSFSIGNYNKAYPLVIDPVIEYSSYLGGTRDDWNFGVAKDKAGNIYLSGNTISGNYPTTAGAYSPKNKGEVESFITKMDPTCSKIIYSTYIGGSGNDDGGKLAVDASGNAYLTANTHSWDFPVTKDALVKRNQGPWPAPHPDIFIVKLSPNGDSLVYGTYFGGSKIDMNASIYADSAGNAYVSLYTESSKLPQAPISINNNYLGKGDAFVMKLDPAGKLIYSTYLGGKEKEMPTCIVADKEGNAIITGTTNSPDFQRNTQTFDTAYHGKDDIFVTKISSDGSKILFSAIMGGKEDESPTVIKVDNEGSIYLTGYTESSDFPLTKNPFQSVFHGKRDAFVTRISALGEKLMYATFLGGTNYDCAYSMELGQSGDVYLAGTTNSSDFPLTVNAYDKTYNGGYYEYGSEDSKGGDIFICQLKTKGSTLNYSTYFGGTGNENFPQLIVNNANDLLLVGQTNSPDLPVTATALNKVKKGGTDIFITKINANSPLPKNSSPELTHALANFTATYKQVFKIDIPENLFSDKDNFEVLPLKFTLGNGDPLPSWMSYVAKTRTLIGLPPQSGKLKIKVTTADNQKGEAKAEFQINVMDPRKEKKTIDLDYGLVAYYPFSGDVKDAGKNEYHGQVKRASLCEDRNGKPNGAYCFNGSDNYIQIDSVKSLDVIDAITVSAWVNPQSYDNFVAWFSRAASENNSQIRTGFGQTPEKNWGLTVFNDGWSDYSSSASQIPLDQWSYVVVTANNITGEAKAYLNGKEVGVWQNIRKFPKSNFPMYIGFQADDNAYFDGKIDEVRIYNRILSPDEIASLYSLK